jgi:DNA-binding response OmpR family regulator/two-component sensor histidine kinase
MGPLDKLKTIIGEGEGKGYLETIDRNAQRLMLLVIQILDERRIDKNQLQLHCRETNMVDFIGGICKLYQYNASQRNITFTFEHEKDHVLAWVDRINFDKVISNLLSNAFKYTFDGGEVRVMLHETEKEVEIQVLDNGVGIKEEEAERLFDRFYQGRNSDDLGMQGTGIGLNLCRSITQMHKGQIKAQNRKDGMQGACFTVSIPKGHAHLKPEQMITETPATKVLSAGTAVKQQFRRFNILIVDDDQEIANYIIGELGGQYKFDHRPNGKEGLKALLTQQYDLVISDVMMPEMDGITMLKRIKDHPQISQIPVIMLTSKAEVEHKLIGLKSGADAYIAKPFSMEELHIQIDNLIDNVRRLRGKFSGAVDQEQRVEKIEVKGNDDALMERIMRSVNAKMSDPDYNIDTLASDVGISRAQLHRKMKEMTGISSGKFLRNLRMEQAARLLREGKINISQVADKVGYMDQAHFSIAFKSHFGMSPSEYVETHKS